MMEHGVEDVVLETQQGGKHETPCVHGSLGGLGHLTRCHRPCVPTRAPRPRLGGRPPRLRGRQPSHREQPYAPRPPPPPSSRCSTPFKCVRTTRLHRTPP